jgi:hypothetical protein
VLKLPEELLLLDLTPTLNVGEIRPHLCGQIGLMPSPLQFPLR